MRCRDVQRQLDLYERQELVSSVLASIDAHLSGCDGCRRELDRLRRLKGLLASAEMPPVPEGFLAGVVSQARRESEPVPEAIAAVRRDRKWPWRGVGIAVRTAAALAAGLLVGALLGFDTWQGGRQSAAVRAADPLSGSGLAQFVEPGGDSLAEAYLGLVSGREG